MILRRVQFDLYRTGALHLDYSLHIFLQYTYSFHIYMDSKPNVPSHLSHPHQFFFPRVGNTVQLQCYDAQPNPQALEDSSSPSHAHASCIITIPHNANTRSQPIRLPQKTHVIANTRAPSSSAALSGGPAPPALTRDSMPLHCRQYPHR